MEEIAELVGCTPAEVRGTASFYDMLHTEPVGRYVVASARTSPACSPAPTSCSSTPRQRSGSGRPDDGDGMFTLEEAECLAGCDNAPCVQVNHRFFGPLDPEGFDRLIDDLPQAGLRRDGARATAC